MSIQRAVIFANGQFASCEQYNKIILPDDLIIAADGGAEHCTRCGISPHVVIGDLDSISSEKLIALHHSATQVIHYPVDKNETDLELAIRYAIDKGCEDIVVLAALGGRWDMSLANLLLLAFPLRKQTLHPSISMKIVDGDQEASILKPGIINRLAGQTGDTLSLIPVFQDAVGVKTVNLKYPLVSETLYFGTTRGISNVFTAEDASVEYRSGLLLCLIIHRSNTQ